MRVIAVVQADLEQSPLGTRSRLGEPLGGIPVLRRTVHRLRRCQCIEKVVVIAPPAQLDATRALVAGSSVTVQVNEAPPPSWLHLVRVGRKWSLDGWRGGIGGTTSFDEHADPRALAAVLIDHPADALLSVNAASAVLAPELTDRMIRQMGEAEGTLDVVFTQAPPGLAGVVLRASLVHELAEKNVPLGWVFAYQPAAPQKDVLFLPCLCEVPADLRYATGRCAADTDRSFERLIRLLDAHAEPDASTVARFLLKEEAERVETLPLEVEIELTTEDPYPEALLHPRGARVPRRGPIDPSWVGRLVDELVAHDDALVVLGGFGDPLRHPHLGDVLEACRAPRDGRTLFGLAVRTTGVDLSDEAISVLMQGEVDVLNVVLDAWSPELYGRLWSPGNPSYASLPAVRDRLERLQAAAFERGSPRPVIVPEFTKARENAHELDTFFDGWIRRFGAVVVRGYSDRAGQLDDRRVADMTPPQRTSCRRLARRCVVLADGRVVPCDEDFLGEMSMGSIGAADLRSIWQGGHYGTLRNAHGSTGKLNDRCSVCREWHRP
ncbi:MAG: SPASM domain-containing protein [Phycisphaerae bacterium]|nr:SPASM domain-containing protein [Phycisphaerae bacterium]